MRDLPGAHLRWIVGGFTVLIRDSDGWASVTGRCTRTRNKLTWAGSWTWTTAVSGQSFRMGAGGQVVDAGTGSPVFRVIGAHRYHRAWTIVVLPGLGMLRFPVDGSRDHNAVMTGVD